jgi:polyhydroxybutyrate depolymerase
MQGPSGDEPDLGATNALVAARPYNSKVPVNYNPAQPTPLVILLHGYGADGVVQDAYFGLGRLVDQDGFLYAYPDGTVDKLGNRFWNATDACCDFFNTGVDDVAYLDAVISDMSAKYNVDPKRIFVTGHSNGGYMSHRFACDRANQVAAFVALAGDDWKDVSRCQPTAKVSVLQVHGDADTEVPYHGDGTSPSAQDSVAGWGQKNGCSPVTDSTGAPIDIVNDMTTTPERWTGCQGGAAELWTMHGAGHIPSFKQPQWPDAIWGWFVAHPKL